MTEQPNRKRDEKPVAGIEIKNHKVFDVVVTFRQEAKSAVEAYMEVCKQIELVPEMFRICVTHVDIRCGQITVTEDAKEIFPPRQP